MNSLLQRVLAEEIERLLDQDDRLKLLTITEVVCEPDLRRAKVYFDSLSEEQMVALEEQRKVLQAKLGTQLTIRRIPLLSFTVDPSIAAGERIEDVLRKIRAQQPEEAE